MRLIDADKVTKPIYAEEDNITGYGMTYDEMCGYNAGIDVAWGRIELAPTVDAAEVVRCKNCKWIANPYCPLFKHPTHSYDDFCSYGEREKVTK